MQLSGLVNTIPTTMVAKSSSRAGSAPTIVPKSLLPQTVATPDSIVLAPEKTVAAAPSAGAAAPAPPAAAAQPTAAAVPSFITTASLASVSGGTAVVTLLWQAARILFGSGAASPWVPFAFALLVGGAIYWLGVDDKNVQLHAREQAIGAFIAFVNSMVLFSAALGINGQIPRP